MKDELEKSFAFILELEKLKAITRKVKPLGLERYENSAEHSWQVTVLALVMARVSDAAVDVEKVIKMLLLHEICEIDAGDVFFFDDAARKDVEASELAAVERIFGILPDETGAEFLEIWKEFERGETAEAKFAKGIDRLMPVLQNLYNNKQSWTENDVTKEQILQKVAVINGAGAAVWETVQEKIKLAFE